MHDEGLDEIQETFIAMETDMDSEKDLAIKLIGTRFDPDSEKDLARKSTDKFLDRYSCDKYLNRYSWNVNE